MKKLTNAQHLELSRYSDNGSNRLGGWSPPGNHHVAAALARMGLLEQLEQSENVRGEGRSSWKEYRKPSANPNRNSR